MIVTSNLAISEWQQAFPNQLLASATLDRLQHRSELLVIDGASYRSRQIKQENKMKINVLKT
jgi:DNA replication protein DnaC